ncbi:MAG TPA: plastocyanin/azurin family copper-binding protein [Longimicrobium sp.]|jgi:plastocyanin
MNYTRIVALAAVALNLTACDGDKPAAGAERGNVVEIRMVSDESGNRFEPDSVAARRGDVLRFTLVSGIHNASFPADRNPGKTGLPAPTELLQSAGQTKDVPLNLAPGEYTYQCDPHVAMGMVGKVVVKD